MNGSAAVASDKEIISLLKNNDEMAMRYILDKYGGALFGSVLRIVRSRPIAEDIVQEAAVKIWMNADSYDPSRGKLFTWMLRIARNTAIDKVRTKKFNRQQKTEQIDSTVYDNVDHSEEINIRDVGLTRVIEQLEEKYRVIIDLLYFQGYTQKECSQELDIPFGTVKSRAKIGIRELRKFLQVGILGVVLYWLISLFGGY